MLAFLWLNLVVFYWFDSAQRHKGGLCILQFDFKLIAAIKQTSLAGWLCNRLDGSANGVAYARRGVSLISFNVWHHLPFTFSGLCSPAGAVCLSTSECESAISWPEKICCPHASVEAVTGTAGQLPFGHQLAGLCLIFRIVKGKYSVYRACGRSASIGVGRWAHIGPAIDGIFSRTLHSVGQVIAWHFSRAVLIR